MWVGSELWASSSHLVFKQSLQVLTPLSNKWHWCSFGSKHLRIIYSKFNNITKLQSVYRDTLGVTVMCYCWNRLHDIVTASRSFMLPLYAQNWGRNVNRMMWTEIRADLICRLNWSFWTESSWVACWVCSRFVAKAYSWLAKWVPSSTTQFLWVSSTALWGVLLWITLEIATEKKHYF